jgi:hypothetical protein
LMISVEPEPLSGGHAIAGAPGGLRTDTWGRHRRGEHCPHATHRTVRVVDLLTGHGPSHCRHHSCALTPASQLDLFLEVSKEMYKLMDLSGKELTLRPEGTAGQSMRPSLTLGKPSVSAAWPSHVHTQYSSARVVEGWFSGIPAFVRTFQCQVSPCRCNQAPSVILRADPIKSSTDVGLLRCRWEP